MAQAAAEAHTVTSESLTPPRTKPRRRLFSKLIRSAALAAGEEVIASTITRTGDGHGITSRVPKMALYGALVNTAITDLILRGIKVLFGGRSKTTQILVTLFIAAPIQKLAHIFTVAYAQGVRSFSRLRDTVQRSLLPAMAMLVFLGPAIVAFAQIFLPQRIWSRFFQHMSLFINVVDNLFVKNMIRRMEKRGKRRRTDEKRRRSMSPVGDVQESEDGTGQ